MAQRITKFASWLDRFVTGLCVLLVAVLMLSMAGTVVLRQGLSTGSLWLQDLAAYAFALLAVFSLPVAMAADRHVRVDILRERQAAEWQRLTDRVALAVFVVPAWGLLSWQAMPLAIEAVSTSEGSPQIGGLPGYFIVRAALPLAVIILCIQAAAGLGCGSDLAQQAKNRTT